MIHDIVEDYIDDIVIKFRRKEDHVSHLKRIFERYKKYKLKIKCSFSVVDGKFYGFVVHKMELELMSTKQMRY